MSGGLLREQIVILHRRLLAIVRDDEVCRPPDDHPGAAPVVGADPFAPPSMCRIASKIQGSRGRVWADVRQSINRARSIGTAEYHAAEMR